MISVCVRGFLVASKFWNFLLINLLEFENFIFSILENNNVNRVIIEKFLIKLLV